MKTIKTIVLAAAFALGSVSTGHAVQVLSSAPALAAYPSLQTIYCDILNRDKVQRNVGIEIMDYFGNVVSSMPTQPLLPDQGTAWGDGTGNGTWCRFTVDGSAKKFRAIAIYDKGAGGYTVTIPAY
jgi:hypothetical protein